MQEDKKKDGFVLLFVWHKLGDVKGKNRGFRRKEGRRKKIRRKKIVNMSSFKNDERGNRRGGHVAKKACSQR